MNLSQTRFTLVTLVAMLGATIALVVIGFTANVEPVYAATCGDSYVYSYNCREGCYNRLWQSCPDGWQSDRSMRTIFQMANPWTQMKVGGPWSESGCGWCNPNCPSTCN